jgi:hypothetical protein
MSVLKKFNQFSIITKSEQTKINGGSGSGWICFANGVCYDWVCSGEKCEWVRRDAGGPPDSN